MNNIEFNIWEDGSDGALRASKLRDETAGSLQKLVEQTITKGDLPKGLFALGQTIANYGNAFNKIFEENQIVLLKLSVGSSPADLEFLPENKFSESQQIVVIEIRRTLAVINVVIGKRSASSVYDRVNQWLPTSLVRESSGSQEMLARHEQYVRKLWNIARIATHRDGVHFATLALSGFRDEFVALEADAVKNKYMRILGHRALGCAAIGGALWWLTSRPYFAKEYADLGSFFLLAVGASCGTWLSFAIRRVQLSFFDLALLEEDRMAPLARIIFVIGLTWIIGAFLSLNIISIEIGEAKFALASGTIMTLLIGALCGIAERALAGVVSKRTEDFTNRLGGIATPTSLSQPSPTLQRDFSTGAPVADQIAPAAAGQQAREGSSK